VKKLPSVVPPPAKDQILLKVEPITHFPGMSKNTNDGPRLHLSDPTELFVAGNARAGPTPQTTLLTVGER